MEAIAVVVLLFLAAFGVNWLKKNYLEKVTKPLLRVETRIEFPFLITLTIQRKEIPWLYHAGVYDRIAVQRNPNALELRLVNSTNPKVIDPFSFFVPLDQTVLTSLADMLKQESACLDKEGTRFSSMMLPNQAVNRAREIVLFPSAWRLRRGLAGYFFRWSE